MLRLCSATVPLCAIVIANAAHGQPTADPVSRAYLFGAAFASSDLSTQHFGGMMFLPGRGLIRWETRGKTVEEQEELKTEAIGLADARAVQAEIDARQAALDARRAATGEPVRERPDRAFDVAARPAPTLSLGAHSGTDRQAGAVAPLTRGAVKADARQAFTGVADGTRFQNQGRLYVFAAVSGRGIGMNLMHDTDAGWRNEGLSRDKGGFIGQRQAGLAFRRGSAQAALSYVQEKTRVNRLGVAAIKDHRAMLSFTYTPPPIR